jgi:hypothetical protein
MHLKVARSILAGIAALLLVACGGGVEGEPNNFFPSANAGSAQSVVSGANVTLDGSGSSDPDGSIAAYSWTQTAGTAVTLTNATTAQPTFVAPTVTAFTTLAFRLVVTDNRGAQSSGATVTVNVSPTSAGVVTLSGVVRFARVPFMAGSPFGLDYANPVLQPSRGVVVRVLDATASTQLATGSTDSSGAYSFSLPGNTNVIVQVVARMQRDTSVPLPRWNVRVQNGQAGSPYTFNSAVFNSSVGTQNVDIPTGISPTGTAIVGQQRSSGAFAILDTIYTAMQAVVNVAPNTSFPALYVDWGSQVQGTFFSPSGQFIGLLADLTQDTDEFDQHVVAHEFGHYIENNFSRSDSIGGSHSLGDRLDMRVAFGEGFGYGFAAIVLDNTDSRDSAVTPGGVQFASRFVVEDNPTSGPGGSGCWCSESSVWSLLWDLYDAAPDGSDNISIGFAPIWQVMTGAQKNTPAMTSIFSFAAALKQILPGDAAGIDALLTGQNIDATGIDAFASTETHAPFGNMLPLYPVITPGATVVVGNSGVRTPTERLYNKAGNHSFLRYVAPTSKLVTVSVTTSNPNGNPDPDFRVFRAGVQQSFNSEDPPALTETGTFNATAGVTYIIDAYDCANGCDPDPPQGTAGDYNLTVTID